MTIEIGDVVTWRSGKSEKPTCMQLAIGRCVVVELGETEIGEPAAKIRLPAIFNNEEVVALVADLEVPE